MYEHYDRILTERQLLLSQFQTRFHQSNCPAVAAAVQRFLETGAVRRAADVPSGFGCRDSGLPFTQIDVATLLANAQAGGHGFQVVVGASNPASGREHYANIVNIRGAVYYVDAFTRPGAISAPNDIAPWLSWANRLEFSSRYECSLAPV